MDSDCAGLQIFHNGKPIELLYLLSTSDLAQTWRVKPLFVPGRERDETIRSTDCCTRLHTQRAA